MNFVNEWAVEEELLRTRRPESVVFTNYDAVIKYAEDSEILINDLDILLTNGMLKDDTRQIIKTIIDPVEDVFEKMKLAIYLMVISADYTVLK